MYYSSQQYPRRGRANWRGYRRGTLGRFPPQEVEDLPELPLGPSINEYNAHEFSKDITRYKSIARITNCSVVASWNWTNARAPEMLIPGKSTTLMCMPPRWSPPARVERLPQDSGDYLRDRNAARYPAHPIEPAILAAMKESPQVCGSNAVDIVACSSTLGNLLRFIRGEEKTFRILVEKVGNTVFLVRRERSPTEKILGVRGHGHTFPEAYTTWNQDVKSSTSHQRVLRYTLGGLQCLVRFEADGYIPDTTNSPEKRTSHLEVLDPSQSTAAALTSAFNTVGVSEVQPANTGDISLKIKQAGASIPQQQIFDLKTRSEWKRDQDTTAQELPRLWLSQLHKFILAHHKDGVFNDVKIHNVRDKVLEWERVNSNAISRFLSLVRRIMDTAEEVEQGKFEVCHMKDHLGLLRFRHQLPDAGSALSPTVRDKWLTLNEKDDSETSASDESSIEAILWDDEGVDYTACSAVCGYCGHCNTVKAY
ncbi:hypothetical protein PFICI_14235 [Pestalotiopsis fici W106-1]|uniref:Geranylgeranyl pyrophosphate synthetase n=1 Tax=Pestalotiopsis fici (strain W106-1 / CGMCC3.15140) TaxID=1229662 RepID=W3WKV4_PESFW|nr:uncharacterized protein PFICI_14235 [Pestalotiopsis fici W106-1]ETS74369.1 hypothetical protein PFICI_14235 [Pestalotiopsis fici W106-1]